MPQRVPNDDEAVLSLSNSGTDAWTVRDSYEGLAVFGGNGSGKTSGSGESIAMRFLKLGYGGVVLTAKPDEAARWKGYLERAGRSGDQCIFAPGGAARFNFLHYEFEHLGGRADCIDSIVSMLQTAMEGGRGRQYTEPFWEDAIGDLLTHAIDLVIRGAGSLNLQDVVRVIDEAPRSPTEVRDLLVGSKRGTPRGTGVSGATTFARMLFEAQRKVSLAGIVDGDFVATKDFWIKRYPNFNSETRQNVYTVLMSRLGRLMRNPYRDLFTTNTTFRPEQTFEDGVVVIVDLPIQSFGETGRFAQVLFKTVWQRAIARRQGGRPAFLWADEGQLFATREDMQFQQIARSSHAATVYLTQSVANFQAALAEADGTSAIVNSFLGCLQTKVFHSNACPVTNAYAEDLFGFDENKRRHVQSAEGHDTLLSVREPNLPRAKFTQLKKGGPANNWIVEGYIFNAGRLWDGNRSKNWLLAQFGQRH